MSLSYLFFFATFGVAMPFLTPALLEIGYSKHQAGLIIAATYAFNTIGPVVGGRLTDKYLTIRQTIRFGSSAMTVASLFLWSFSGNPSWLFLAAILAFSAFRAPMVSLQDALAMQVAADHPGAYSRMRVAGSLGFILASTAFGYLAAAWGMMSFFPALCFCCAAFAVQSWFLPKGFSNRQKQVVVGFWRHLDKAWWLWLAAMMLHWIAFSPYHYGFSLLLEEQGVAEHLMGWFWSIGVGAEIVVFLCSSWFFKRWHYRNLLFLALFSNLIRWIIVGLFPIPWVLALTQLLHGFGFALFYASAMQAIAQFSGGHNRASYQGLFSTAVGGFSAIIGSALSGWLHEMMSLDKMILWCIPLQILAILLLVINPLKNARHH